MNANDILLRWRELKQQQEQFQQQQESERMRAAIGNLMQMRAQEQSRQQPIQEFLFKQKMMEQDPQYQLKLQLLRQITPQMGGQPQGQTPINPFARQPIPQYFVKNAFADDLSGMIGARTPQDMQAMQYQQDVGRFKAAQGEYAIGKGMNRQAMASMPPAQRAEWIRNRMTNFPGARGAIQELRPAYGGKQFTQNEQGLYKEDNQRINKNAEFANASRLRKEFIDRPEVKEYMTTNTNVKAMDKLLNEALNNPNKNLVAVDQALITMYNKMTDPNSVVRESEYARTPENLPLFNRVEGAIAKIKRGGAGMTNADRQAIVDGAKILANSRGQTFNERLMEYTDLATANGIDANLVTRGVFQHKDFGVNNIGSMGGGRNIQNIKAQYNALRNNGMSAEEAKKRLGL